MATQDTTDNEDFAWTAEESRPVLLVGGGAGIVPLHAMLTAHKQSGSTVPMKLLYSVKTYADVLYKEDFLDSPDVLITLTKNHPKDWKGSLGRINSNMLRAFVGQLGDSPLCYVCGSESFVGSVSDLLQDFGIPAQDIKTKRLD